MESGNLSDNSPPSDLLRRLTPTLLSSSILICKRIIIPTLLTSQGCREDRIQKRGGRCLVHLDRGYTIIIIIIIMDTPQPRSPRPA